MTFVVLLGIVTFLRKIDLAANRCVASYNQIAYRGQTVSRGTDRNASYSHRRVTFSHTSS